jgi:hypothetical protein
MNDIAELDDLWTRRYELESLAKLEMQFGACGAPQEYALLWRLARYLHFRAMQCDERGDKEQAKQYFQRGAEAGKAAMQCEAYEIEGCFWRGVNELEAARHTSTLAAMVALRSGTALIERAAKMDETYHFAGPLRVLGRIIHRKPLLLGGSANVAREYFKRALQIAPHNSTTQLYYVEALLTEQQKPEARHILNEIISAPDDEDWRWEQERDRKRAQELLHTF